MTDTAERHLLHAALRRYEERRGSDVGDFIDLLQTHPLAFERADPHGHFTGSAWLVSADGRRVLLTHHRKLGRWLQLGGHADGDMDLARVALREAQEESGLDALVGETDIFDLDRHRIPARAGEPEHWHYDVRYVVHARGSEVFAVSAESHALAWRDIAGLASDPATEESVARMARRWLDERGAG